MLVLTPKYGSQIDLDLIKKQKAQKKEPYLKHRLTLDLTTCKTIKKAYLTFLKNKEKYVIGYKPKDAKEINRFVNSLGEIDTLDVSWIDVSELNSLAYCFRYCEYVKHIVGLDKWDVSNVETMYEMFNKCKNLESIDDISGWDVSNVERMGGMFGGCKNLESIGNISGWDVSNVEGMPSMFSECKNLESIGDISGWDVSNVKNIDFMFYGCEKLENVGDLEQWNLSQNVNKYNIVFNSAIKRPSWYK